jgi:hypothetical protein
MQLDHYKTKAKTRLEEICKETCLICLNIFRKANNNNPSNIQNFNGNFKLKIFQQPRIENNIIYNICYEEHLFCKKCSDSFKNENKKSLRKEKNSKSFTIFCNICEVPHEFLMENILKIFKGDGGCCLIF